MRTACLGRSWNHNGSALYANGRKFSGIRLVELRAAGRSGQRGRGQGTAVMAAWARALALPGNGLRRLVERFRTRLELIRTWATAPIRR